MTLKIDDANLAHASVHSGSPGAAQGRNLLSTTALLSICSRHGWSSVGSIHGLGWVGCLSQQHANIRSFDEGVRVAQKSCTFFNTPYFWNRSPKCSYSFGEFPRNSEHFGEIRFILSRTVPKIWRVEKCTTFLDHPVVKCVHLGIDSVENLVANR